MSTPADFPTRPPSEIEWEELLVRYEIGPRALRIALEDGSLTETVNDRLRDLLYVVVHNEHWTRELFAAMRTGKPAPPWPDVLHETLPGDPLGVYQLMADLRARNFAAVQRRGLEVWNWHTDSGPHGPVTAHQLIQHAVALDGETLASVREALRGAGVG